jgi:hypothetical protein
MEKLFKQPSGRCGAKDLVDRGDREEAQDREVDVGRGADLVRGADQDRGVDAEGVLAGPLLTFKTRTPPNRAAAKARLKMPSSVRGPGLVRGAEGDRGAGLVRGAEEVREVDADGVPGGQLRAFKTMALQKRAAAKAKLKRQSPVRGADLDRGAAKEKER